MRSDPFKAAVESGDSEAMAAALSPAVSFKSPAVHKPYEGREATMMVLAAVGTVFEDFEYRGRFASDDGEILLFSARVGDRDLDGVDILRFGEDGLVSELTVMIRPYSGLTAVLEAMARALANGNG